MPRYNINPRIAALALISAGFTSFNTSSAQAQQDAKNIAAHRPVTFNVRPNYALCTDPEDALQLTDELYSSGANLREVEGTQAIWVQKGTVGWKMRSPVIITVDLGKVEPISGASFSTAAGQSDVHWPSAIWIAVSDDGQNWRGVDDLVSLSKRDIAAPPESGYRTHHYGSNKLQARGRYVSFAVENKPYLFVDEIQVFRGDDSWLQKPATSEPISSPKNWVLGKRIRAAELRRLHLDSVAVRSIIEKSDLAPQHKETLLSRLEKLNGETETLRTPDATTFRTTFPQNKLHEKLWAVYGAFMSNRLPAVTAWKQHRFGWLSPTDAPQKAPAKTPALDIQMMRNESRADDFLLTNASEKIVQAQLKVTGFGKDANPNWLQVSQVPWTDTFTNVPVAAALPEAPFRDGAYQLSLPAGLPSKIWLTVDSSKLAAGNHRGEIVVSFADKKLWLPLSVRVSSVVMPRPRLALGMWDYTNGSGLYGMNAKNMKSAIALMQSHGVDTPWATMSAFPWPSAGDFDGNHQLTAPLNFANFDEWVNRWPNARRYFVFANVQRTFANATLGTPEFNARVGAWAKALSAHMKELKLKPQQLGILLVDEPETEEEDERVAAWAKAINATAPELTLFQDPVWLRPDQTKNQDAITEANIICPDLTQYNKGGQPVREYFQARRAAGQEFWVYQCSGPNRTYSPTRYFRQQAWHAFQHDATGMGFWSFADLGSAKSSWNEYLAAWHSYVPAFLGEDDATDSVQWQAVREGVQDYEYFSLLRDAAQRTKNKNLRVQAQTLLASMTLPPLPTEFKEGTAVAYNWNQPEDPQTSDVFRLKVLSLLEKMAAKK
jgi:hypothetical protein